VRKFTYLSALVVFALYPFSGNAETFSSFDSGSFSELIGTLPGDGVPHVVYSVDVGSINAGDIVMADSEAQMTNDSGVPAQLAGQLILASASTSTTGTELDEANTFQLTPDMHHGNRLKGSIENFLVGPSKHFINYIAWTDEALTVEQNHGRLQVVIIHP
jgi:hypothetical protein